MASQDFDDFFVAWVNCTSNNLVIISENANTNMPNTIPIIAFIEPRDNMKRNVTAELISPSMEALMMKYSLCNHVENNRTLITARFSISLSVPLLCFVPICCNTILA
jgi:hypothetical protein